MHTDPPVTDDERAAWERILDDVARKPPRKPGPETKREAALRARLERSYVEAKVRHKEIVQGRQQRRKTDAARMREKTEERARKKARNKRLRLLDLPPEKLQKRRIHEAICRRCDRTFLFEARSSTPALPADCGRDECYAETKRRRKLWATSPRSMVHTCMHCLAELPLEQRFPYCDLDCHRNSVAKHAWAPTGVDPAAHRPNRGPREQTWGERHFVRIGGVYLAKRRRRVFEPDPSATPQVAKRSNGHVQHVVEQPSAER